MTTEIEYIFLFIPFFHTRPLCTISSGPFVSPILSFHKSLIPQTRLVKRYFYTYVMAACCRVILAKFQFYLDIITVTMKIEILFSGYLSFE